VVGPILAVICSHWFWMALSAQMSRMRVEPPSPAPGSTIRSMGGGASAQEAGSSLLPTLKPKKSSRVGREGVCARSAKSRATALSPAL